MGRYNTVASTGSITTTATVAAPQTGLLTTLTGTAPYTVTLANPALYAGQTQAFWNTTGGTVTLSLSGVTGSPTIKGPSTNSATTFAINGNQVVSLTSDGTNYIVTGIVGSGSFVNVDVTGTYTAVASQTLWVNTTSSAVTVTLPIAPVKGDTIRIIDIANNFNTNNLSIARNGQPIMSNIADATMVVATQGAAFDLIYYNSTYGWRIFTI